MKSHKTVLMLIALVCACSVALAQDLNSLASAIKDKVGTVQTGSKTYEAKLDVQASGALKYGFDEVDSKGARTAYAYEFNLADIDPYAVRELTQKDAIYAVLGVRNKQKLVKVIKNGEVEPYDNEVKIIAKDIETVREIIEAVKKAIPAAEKAVASRLKVSGYDAMINWLTTNVKDVAVGTKTYTQSMTKGPRVGTLVFKEVTTDSKRFVRRNLHVQPSRPEFEYGQLQGNWKPFCN
jgi:hypothetical protein